MQISDVFIASFPTSGSVWVQNILHLLRTKGTGDDFDEICYVVPYVTENKVDNVVEQMSITEEILKGTR